MFSCLFLEDEGEKLLAPSRCELRLVSLGGLTGRGRATVCLETERPVRDLVLYVPSLLCYPPSSGARCSLRVTSCQLRRRRRVDLAGSSSSEEENLELTSLKWHERDSGAVPPATGTARPGPPLSYTQLRTNLERLVLKYGAAQSSNDLLLYIGDLPDESLLDVQLSFITNNTPAIDSTRASSSFNCYYVPLLPVSGNVSLEVTMDLPSDTAVTSVVSINDESILSHQQSVTDCSFSVGLTYQCPTAVRDNIPPPGIIVTLSPNKPIVAHCQTVLLQKPISIDEETTCDGVQMIDYLFTPIANDYVSTPGEFIFMVDCSGSMSGLKVQSAAESLVFAIKSLPPSCWFNVIAFGSKFRVLFQSSMDASSHRNVEQGVQFANQMQACLGGTELLSPIRWVFKRLPPQNGLLRHFFLITDGGVPNVPVILQLATKHKYNSRFHTFALGSEICTELMAGLAVETGGHYSVINESDRLQTKVMEVLQGSLSPSLQNVSITCSAPAGYTIIDTPVSSIATPPVFHQRFQTSYSLLKRKQPDSSSLNKTPTLNASATIVGSCCDKPIECTVSSLVEINPSSDRCIAVLQSSAWVKMAALEEKMLLLQSHRHQKSTETAAANGELPPAKKPCRNGTVDISKLREELIELSLRSSIPYYPYTCYRSLRAGGVCQITPWSCTKSLTRKTSLSSEIDTVSVNVPLRKRPRNKPVPSSSFGSPSLSLTSLARQTVSGIGTVARAAVNLVTLGYVNLESEPVTESAVGHRIEDQEYYQNKSSRIHWDKDHQLVLPDIYYTTTTSDDDSRSFPPATDSRRLSVANSDTESLADEECLVEQPVPYCNRQVYYIPLVQMQLPSGAWPLVPAIGVVTGVSMKSIVELPCSPDSQLHCNGATLPNNNSSSSNSKGHIWATALALGFLRTHCAQFEIEWSLLAAKGQQWLALHKDSVTPLSLVDINKTALKLLTEVT